MSNFVYSKTKQALLNGNINFTSDQFKVLLIDSSSYTPNQLSDEFVSDINSSAIIHRTSAISNITNTLGTIDADDLSIVIPSNTSFDALVLFQNKTSDNDSRLILHIDVAEGLPFVGTLSETSMSIIWSNTNTKILSI